MTEEEERKRGSFNLTLLEEVKASAAFTKHLRESRGSGLCPEWPSGRGRSAAR